MISEALERDSASSVPPSDDPDITILDDFRLGRVSYAADGEPLSVVVADLAYELGISIIVDAGVDRAVTLVVNDVEAAQVFVDLADQANARLEYTDGLLRFVPRDRAGVASIGVYRPGFDDPDGVVETSRLLLGRNSVVRRLGDRVVVGGDRSQLQKFGELTKYLEAGPDSWLLEVHLVSLTAGVSRSLGLDWSVAGTFEASLGESIGDVLTGGTLTGARAAAVVAAMAELSMTDRHAKLLTVARLHLLEGTPVRFSSGEVTPVPQRTVSDQGTVTTTGFRDVETGFIIDASGRRVPGGLHLDIRPTLSSVTGFVDGAPIIARRALTTSVIVASGEWVILTGFDDWRSDRTSDLLPLGRRRSDDSDSRFVILIRAERTRHAMHLPTHHESQ